MHPFIAEALLAIFIIVEGIRLLNANSGLYDRSLYKIPSWRASFAGVAIQKKGNTDVSQHEDVSFL